jgi:hypothetical protein
VTAKPRRKEAAIPKSESSSPAKEPASSPKTIGTIADTALEKMILAKMPDFNPEWSKEAQESWLDTINKLMDRFQKKSGD